MKNSQHQRIIRWFKNNPTLTRLQALQHLGIFELSGRLTELQRMGYLFDKTQRVKVSNRYGESTNVVQYRLVTFAVK